MEHRGHRLEEFDLDGALARKPELLIVDELAHTNVPGSRHPKRWQDVEELLDGGINVWTALNIQHLESLADVVTRITGVQIRETMPDLMLQEADDVVLVDITPEELIQRLHEGKVYVPETAARAMTGFFTLSNLTALRELALRRTADRVDDQMIGYLRQKDIEGPWETAERLLVCVGKGADAGPIVRKAARIATGLNASWMAVHVQRLDAQAAGTVEMQSIGDALQLAERLGADVMRLPSSDFVNDILRLARRENVTQIIIGRSRVGSIGRLLGRSLPDQLIRHAGDIGIQVAPSAAEPPRSTPGRRVWPGRAGLAGDVAAALVSAGVAVMVGELISIWQRLPNLSMIFLASVIFSAVTRGVRAAVLAAAASFLAYNFFFIAPTYTLTIAEPHELFALLIYLAVAILTGSLAGRLQQQSARARHRTQAAASLAEFSRKLSGASSVDDVLWAAATHAHRMLGFKVVMLLPQDGELEPRTAWPPEELLNAAETSAARWAFERAEAAGWRTGTLPTIKLQFRPLITPRATVGVFGFVPVDPAAPLDPQKETDLAAILEPTAIALDRALLVGEAVKAAALQENENIRQALLASLSHDLRTPLAAITGAATSLSSLGDRMSADQRRELLDSIQSEAARMSRFVTNLLDMSRIESGAIRTKSDWVDVADVVRAAVARVETALGASPRISIAAELPFVRGDSQLLEQVLFNLLDNAQKYGGGHGVAIHARQEGDQVAVSVSDEGPGVKPELLERIFEKFYRAGRPDGRRPGTGLGLAICRGLVEAMGGTITAQSPAARRRGLRIVVRFPAARPEGQDA